MSKSLKLSFSFVLTILLGIVLTACMPKVQNENHSSAPASTQVLVFANEAAVSAYTYNFASYPKQFQAASHYFTPNGWKNYQNALVKSGNLKTVRDKKMVVSAVATGTPLITAQAVKAGKYIWQVQMPLLVSYQTAWKKQSQKLNIHLTIVSASQPVGMRGLAVRSLVANPESK